MAGGMWMNVILEILSWEMIVICFGTICMPSKPVQDFMSGCIVSKSGCTVIDHAASERNSRRPIGDAAWSGGYLGYFGKYK